MIIGLGTRPLVYVVSGSDGPTSTALPDYVAERTEGSEEE